MPDNQQTPDEYIILKVRRSVAQLLFDAAPPLTLLSTGSEALEFYETLKEALNA